MNIVDRMVLGTAQFGIDYGIANIIGKPSKKETFRILELAWEKGIRRFDTAPSYGSEELLGKFINVNGLGDEAIVLTKIPSLEQQSWDYKKIIRTSIESSLKNLGGSIEVLFFHNPIDSILLLKDPDFFNDLLNDYPLSTHGVSVYNPHGIEKLSGCEFELAFQFPFNVLDQRFEQVKIPQGNRYARSVFLQGLLASPYGLRPNTPLELLKLQKEYHDRLANYNLEPIGFAVSFAALNNALDYFIIGVDTAKQLKDILNLDIYKQKDIAIVDELFFNFDEQWLDPRNWS
tara:strand:+ start:770 stop:1636 length:867 start_codon:yes stop_codon:yes gene_type:complete